MAFQIGDKVIHSMHGLGEIVNIEKMLIHDRETNCYVVRTPELTVWIPIDDIQQHSLRTPTSPEEFTRLFTILTSPSETLPENRVVRKEVLMAQLKDGQLASICRIVRDLRHFLRTAKSNDQEKSILERATKSLLAEWTYSFNVPMLQAQQAVEKLLQA